MTYLPRLREWRRSHGRRIETRPPLFPGYCFFVVEAQWHAARWSVGIIGLIMDGIRPARVADAVIAEIRGREVGELIELAPPSPLRPGARVRILRGVFRDHLAVYADMKPRERVEILLQLLGGEQRVTLAKKDIEVCYECIGEFPAVSNRAQPCSPSPMTPRLPASRIQFAATRIRKCRRGQRLQTSKKLAAALAELHRLRAINCAAKTQRDPDATLN